LFYFCGFVCWCINVDAGFKLSETKAGLRFEGNSFDDNQNGKGTYQVYPAHHSRLSPLFSSPLFYPLLTTFLVPFSLLYTLLPFSSCPLPILSFSLFLSLSSLFSLSSQPVCQPLFFEHENMLLMSSHKSGYEHLHFGKVWQRRASPV